MSKKELKREIAALRAQVEMLSRQVAQQRPIVIPSTTPYVYPSSPTYPYTVWSDVMPCTTATNTFTLNRRDDGEPPALSAVS